MKLRLSKVNFNHIDLDAVCINACDKFVFLSWPCGGHVGSVYLVEDPDNGFHFAVNQTVMSVCPYCEEEGGVF